MISDIARADATPLPLPESAWRITPDLQNGIRQRLMAAGHFIHGDRIVDNDYRRWQLRLNGHTIDVFVDSEVIPGSLSISVQGEAAAIFRRLLCSYKWLPILKISRTLNARQLLEDFPNQRLLRTFAKTERLKLVVRWHLRQARYKIVDEKHVGLPAGWAIRLKTTQQLQIERFAYRVGDAIVIDGFGTELNRLRRLMEIFDS
jgi:hypothetical protein